MRDITDQRLGGNVEEDVFQHAADCAVPLDHWGNFKRIVVVGASSTD